MKSRTYLSLILAAAVSFSISAVAQTTNTQAPAQSDRTQIARGVRNPQLDQQILKEVQDKLKKDRFKNVQASVDDQVVTLTGSVDLYSAKQDALNRVDDIRNVQGVRNQIQVSSSMPDDQLREKLAGKLAYDRVGQGVIFNALTLQVNNGVVTVGGHVRDNPDRASALAIAANQPGVKQVIDNIEVAPVSGFDDDLRIRLARAIYGPGSPLQRYGVGSSAPIRIVVENGQVTLEGVVNSQADKQLAGNQANSISGVFKVTNNLMVANSESAKK